MFWSRMTDLSSTVKTINANRPRGAVQTYLLVLKDGRFEARLLPSSGDVVIGRSEKATVTIDEPSISRQHAILHLGPPMAIEDLGSSNGVTLRDQRLEPNRPAPIEPNEVVQLGSVMLVVQQRTAPIRTQRIRSHDYFEGRLAEECARADRRPFALLRIDAVSELAGEAVHDAFAEVLRPVDVVAAYGPRAFEVFLADAQQGDAERVARRLVESVRALGSEARVGIAYHPDDGRDPDSLVERAAASARGERVEEERPDVVVLEPTMQRLYDLGERVAVGDISVLILGETGAGKEILAEHIHRRSTRAAKPYVRLNCAALSESLLESELFGHEKGSFTGALKSKPGLLETASGGTVFLDEIGDVPPSAQVKLLRVMEEKKVLRVGGLAPRTVDVRFVAATNRDLEEDVADGRFREDLYYRIAGVTLVIPPLRERIREIMPLAETFAQLAARRLGRRTPSFSAGARGVLEAYSWPGNIRELRNVIERAVLLAGDEPIDLEHLPVDKMTGTWAGRSRLNRPTEPSDEPAPAGARERILEALTRCGGNQTEAAKLLGVSRRTLGKWMEDHAIPRPRKSGG
jgi:two-component system, NtrC family, response regulator AtoC